MGIEQLSQAFAALGTVSDYKEFASQSPIGLSEEQFTDLGGLLKPQRKSQMRRLEEQLEAELTRQGIELSDHGFDRQLYTNVLALTRLACIDEANTGAEVNAYKLCVAFGSMDNILRYLSQFAQQNPNTKQMVHDACLFSLPQSNDWNLTQWRQVFLRASQEGLLRKYNLIDSADKLQQKLLELKICALSVPELYTKVEQQTQQVGELEDKLRQERRKGKNATKETVDALSGEIKAAKKVLQQLQNQAKKLPTPLKEVGLDKLGEVVIALSYQKKQQDPKAAALFKRYNLSESVFNEWLELKPQNSDEQIPKLFIDGTKHDTKGWYVIKLHETDPKAAILGELTACCQSLGKQGGECAKHGIQSDSSGFYVICRGKPPKSGDSRDIDPKDIRAQTWVTRTTDGGILLDSLEAQPNVMAVAENQQAIKRMALTLAHELVIQHDMRYVNIGEGGMTPKGLGYKEENVEAQPLNYDGYRDSFKQRRMCHREKILYLEMLMNPEKAAQRYQQDPGSYLKDSDIFYNILCSLPPEQFSAFYLNRTQQELQVTIVQENLFYFALSSCNEELALFLLNNFKITYFPAYDFGRLYDGDNEEGNYNILNKAIILGMDRLASQMIRDGFVTWESVIGVDRETKRLEGADGICISLADWCIYNKGYRTLIELILKDYPINQRIRELFAENLNPEHLVTISNYNMLLSDIPQGDFLIGALKRVFLVAFFSEHSIFAERARSKFDFLINELGFNLDKADLSQVITAHNGPPLGPDSQNYRVTPLSMATSCGWLTAVDYLLEHGADSNAIDNSGEQTDLKFISPLEGAVRCGDKNIVLKLLDAGADPERKNKDGKTPLDLAESDLATTIMDYIEQKNASRRIAQFSQERGIDVMTVRDLIIDDEPVALMNYLQEKITMLIR